MEERRGALVALLNPTPQLEELHNWIHTSIDGLVGLEPHPFEPHVKLLDEGTLPVGETPEKHLATLAKNGRLLDIDSACLQVDGFEAHKLTFTQAAKEDEPSLWFALREFAI